MSTSYPLVLKLSGVNLAPKDSNKKSDPFYVIIRSDAKSYKRPNMENDQPLPDARRNYAGHSITNDVSYRSETITEDLNPNWKTHTIDTFCESSDDKVDLNMKLLIDVWDEDFFPKVGKDFIGYCEPTIAELLECAVNRTPLSLKPPPLPHNQNPGKLFVDVALLGFPKVFLTDQPQEAELGSACLGEPEVKPRLVKANTTLSVGKREVLQGATYVLAVNHCSIVIAKASLEPASDSGGSLILSFTLPERIDGPEQLALGAELLEQQLRSVYSQGLTVAAWALTGQGKPTAECREELCRLEKEYRRLLQFRAYVGIGEEDVPGKDAFQAMVKAQMNALLANLAGMYDPFSRQSTARSDNRAIANDRINRYSGMLKKLVDAAQEFEPAFPGAAAFVDLAQKEFMERVKACLKGGLQALTESQSRFGTVEAELMRLQTADESILMEVKQLPLRNFLLRHRMDLEKALQKHIDDLPLRCCTGSALKRSGLGGELSEDDAKSVQDVVTALFEAQGMEWRCQMHPQDQARSKLDGVIQAVETYTDEVLATFAALTQKGDEEGQYAQFEVALFLDSALERLAPSAVSGSTAKMQPYGRAIVLLQKLKTFLGENSRLQQTRMKFREALRRYDKVTTKELIQKSIGDSLDVKKFHAYFIREIRVLMRIVREETRSCFDARPVRVNFDDLFIKRWDFFCDIAGADSVRTLLAEVRQKIGDQSDPEGNEFSDAVEELREALIKEEMEAKSMILKYMAQGTQASGGNSSLSTHFREPADALSFLLALVDLKTRASQTSTTPFTGDQVGSSCVDVIAAIYQQFKEKLASLGSLLSEDPVNSDFDFESVAQVLEGLQLRADLYVFAKGIVLSNSNISRNVTFQEDCSRQLVTEKISTFLTRTFRDAPRLTESIPPSSCGRFYTLLGKKIRGSIGLRHLKEFFDQTNQEKAFFRDFCVEDAAGNMAEGRGSVFCRKVEKAVDDLLKEIDRCIGALPSVGFSDRNRIPAVSTLQAALIPELRKIDALTNNVKFFRQLVSQHFPWVMKGLAKHDGIGALNDRFLRIVQYFESLPVDKTDEIAGTLVYLHVYATEIVMWTDDSRALIEAALSKFKERNKGQAVLKLGAQLKGDQFVPFGERVVQSYDAFKANVLDVFNKKTSGQDINYVLTTMTCGGSASMGSSTGLRSAYDELNTSYNAIIQKAVESQFSAVFTSSVVSDVKTLGQRLKGMCSTTDFTWKAEVARQIPGLLAQIFALWTLQSSEKFLKSLDADSKASYLCRPHPVQIAAIFCLLGLGPPKASLEGKLERCLVQVKTGEGKTVVLGVTACVFALLGIEVCCACYSEYLSKRDKESMDPLFRALDVESSISYCTLVKLCEDEINKRCNIRDNVEAVVLGKSPSRRASSAVQGCRVLLVDEVDVFFSDDFYGQPFSPACDLFNESLEKLLRCFWSKQAENPSFSDVVSWPAYTEARKHFKDCEFLLNSAVSYILADLKSFADHKYEVVGGKIGYKEQDSIVFNVRYGYKTMFAYLKEESSGRVSRDEKKKYLKLLVNCGTFLFAKFPNQFSLVSGVTGTLETLSDGEKELIRHDYQIDKLYYLPSAYGKNTQFVDNGIVLTVSATDHETEILRNLEQNVKGRAVLVFFDSYERLDKFYNSPAFSGCLTRMGETLTNVNVLVEQTPPANKQQIVSSRATSKNAVTLATKPFGRGTDFISMDVTVNKNGGIHVIQTFLSETMSEEIQIKGRTARQGDPGTFSMILNADDLRESIQIGVEEVDEIKAAAAAGSADTLKQLLQSKRARLFDGKFLKLKSFVAEHESLDVEAWAFIRNLASNKTSEVMKQIRLWNKPARMARILVLVDATGSMQGMMDQLKNNLAVMFQRAKETLDTVIKDGSSAQFEMQIAVYRNYGSGKDMLLERSAWVSNPQVLVDYLQGLKAKGGEGNEAVEIGLAHATKQPDLKQVVLIGDAAANSQSDIEEKRGGVNGKAGFGYEPLVCKEYWIGTEYQEPTNYETEARKLASLNPPVKVDAYYLVQRSVLKQNFGKIAEITGGKSEYLDVNSPEGKEMLIGHITKAILFQVGGDDLGKALVEQYTKKYV